MQHDLQFWRTEGLPTVAELLREPDQVKVFILYLLEKIGYPLNYTDIGTIIIRDGLVDYFTFVECFQSLLEGEHIEGKRENGEVVDPENFHPDDDGILYTITRKGKIVAEGLADDLLGAAVREKSYISAMRHLSLEKRGAIMDQSCERDGEGYIFHCSIKDNDGLAMKLSLRADTFNQLRRMQMNFEDKPDVVLRGITALVTGNVNYLFEN